MTLVVIGGVGIVCALAIPLTAATSWCLSVGGKWSSSSSSPVG